MVASQSAQRLEPSSDEGLAGLACKWCSLGRTKTRGEDTKKIDSTYLFTVVHDEISTTNSNMEEQAA